MGDKLLLSLVISILLVSPVSAVVINEFTVDPQTDWDGNNGSANDDEWYELYNPSSSSVDLTNWTLLLIDSTNATQILSGTIPAFGYKVILNPTGSHNLDGQIQLLNSLSVLQDSVTYGDWDDGNVSDNAPDGNAASPEDECLARIPNGADTDVDFQDFQKVTCTYNSQNRILGENEQGLDATILGKIVMKILPRFIDFGAVRSPSTNNPSLNGNITLNATGSEENVNVEITEVLGSPFDVGLKVDGIPANQSLWNLPCNLINNTCVYDIIEAEPTLDVPSDFPPGPAQGTIVYTISGPTP